jgi:hypothetical protein
MREEDNPSNVSAGRFGQFRIDDHPFCGQAKCYDAKWAQYGNRRTACNCKGQSQMFEEDKTK